MKAKKPRNDKTFHGESISEDGINPRAENALALALAYAVSSGTKQPLQQLMSRFLNDMAAAGYTIEETPRLRGLLNLRGQVQDVFRFDGMPTPAQWATFRRSPYYAHR